MAGYLALVREDAPQRRHDLRAVFNTLRWMVRVGGSWRMLPNDFPPWQAVHQQTQRWIAAGVFKQMVHDLRAILRLADGRRDDPFAVILDGRTVQSTPESGHRAGYDGYKHKKGSKVHRRGHAGPSAGLEGHAGRRARAGAGGQPGRGGVGSHGRIGGTGVCRSGLHRRAARGRCPRTRDQAGSGEAVGGEEELRATPATLGGRAELRLGHAVPMAGQGLRTPPSMLVGLHFLAFACLMLAQIKALLGQNS